MFKSQITNPCLSGRQSGSPANPESKLPKFKTPQSWPLIILAWGIILSLLVGNCNLTSFAQEAQSKEEESLFVAKKAFEDGFYEVSLGLLERFLINYPDSPKAAEANLIIGKCYFYQNKFLDALKKFEEILKEPGSRDIQDAALYWIAEVHFRGNNFSRAAQYYKKIIDEFPGSSYAADAYYSLAWCLFQEKSFSEALSYFKIVEEKFPKETLAQDASFKIVECLYNLKDYAAIEERVKSYLKIYAKDTSKAPYLHFYAAEAQYYMNNFEAAIDEYSKVITNTADDKMKALSRLGMAWSYLKLKQYQQAQDSFDEVGVANLEKTSKDIFLLGKAALMSETKRLSEANQLYSELIDTNPQPLVLIQAYLGKAETLYNMAQYRQAIDLYKEALAKLPESAQQEIIDKLHYGLAWAYLKEGEFKSAIEEFQKIAKQTEDKTIKVAALCQVGDAYQDSGDYTKAIQTYDGILKNYPDSFYSDYVQYQLGLTLLKSSNYDGAILSFQSLKANYPDSKLLDDATYALALSYFQRENYNAACDILKKFQQEFKDSNLKPQSRYLLGTSLYNLGKFSEAVEVFKDITKNYSQDTELVQKAEYEIADCFYQMGNEKEAMERFKLLRLRYPDSSLAPEVIWWLGEYYYRHNDLVLARRYFSSLIQDFPKTSLISDAYYALGTICQEESKYEEAIDNFKQVVELGKSDLAGTSAVAIADIKVKQGQFDAAISLYNEVIRDYANLEHLIYPKIAETYRNMNKYEEALKFYNKSLSLVPARQVAQIQFKIAETKEAQGKKDEAIEEYLKVTYLYSENNELCVKSLLRIAAIYEDKDDFKEALNVYKKIISMNVEEAKYAQERIDWIDKHAK
jgi:TolA-binding protein